MTDDKLKQAHVLRERILGLESDIKLLNEGFVILQNSWSCKSGAGRLNVDDETNNVIVKILLAQRQIMLENLRAEYAAL